MGRVLSKVRQKWQIKENIAKQVSASDRELEDKSEENLA